MSGFVVIAAVLTLAALAAVAYPLLREREGVPVAWRSAALVALVTMLACAALYPLWSNFNWQEPEPALDSPAAMVGRLARKLEKNPDDLQGWLLLGRSYSVIQQYPLAIRAYQRADTLAKGQSPEAAMGLAEALVESGRSDLAGRAGRLFEQALSLDDKSVKAIFYSALAARERNELPLARERFQRLLDGNPPADVSRIIQEQISAIDAMSAMVAAAPVPRAGAAVAGASSAAAAPAVTVQLRVSMAGSVAGNAAAGAPLFVLARVPGQRGAPLAAKRLDARFPQDVELLSTDAMIAGSGFAAGQELEIEARVANGGSAISRSGDPFGTVRVKAGSGGRIAVEINQLKP